jgi:hypothetical protein
MIEDWQLAPLPADELLEAWAAEAEERDIPRDNVQWRRTRGPVAVSGGRAEDRFGGRAVRVTGREATEGRPG